MSIINRLSKFGSAYRRARRNAEAIRYMNELPPQLQKDIGWTPGGGRTAAPDDFPLG